MSSRNPLRVRVGPVATMTERALVREHAARRAERIAREVRRWNIQSAINRYRANRAYEEAAEADRRRESLWRPS